MKPIDPTEPEFKAPTEDQVEETMRQITRLFSDSEGIVVLVLQRSEDGNRRLNVLTNTQPKLQGAILQAAVMNHIESETARAAAAEEEKKKNSECCGKCEDECPNKDTTQTLDNFIKFPGSYESPKG